MVGLQPRQGSSRTGDRRSLYQPGATAPAPSGHEGEALPFNPRQSLTPKRRALHTPRMASGMGGEAFYRWSTNRFPSRNTPLHDWSGWGAVGA